MTPSLCHPTPLFHPQPHRAFTFSTPNNPLFSHHAQPPSSSQIAPPLTHSHSSSYPSSSSAIPHTPKSKTRPKHIKKCSTTGKQRTVQVALEVKVEKAKGFHAFFVPLARALPPAPPSSPVLGQRAPPPSTALGGEPAGGDDYFAGWDKQKTVGRREEWVEDVSGEESMEIDSE